MNAPAQRSRPGRFVVVRPPYAGISRIDQEAGSCQHRCGNKQSNRLGNMVAGDDNSEWLSVAEAARRLGVSRQAIQNRIKRGRIEHRQDNRGNPMVCVAATPGQPVSGATCATEVAPPEQATAAVAATGMVSLSDVRAMLGEQAERQQRQHEAEIARLERAWRGVLESQTEKYLRVMMANRSRPWWRFW